MFADCGLHPGHDEHHLQGIEPDWIEPDVPEEPLPEPADRPPGASDSTLSRVLPAGHVLDGDVPPPHLFDEVSGEVVLPEVHQALTVHRVQVLAHYVHCDVPTTRRFALISDVLPGKVQWIWTTVSLGPRTSQTRRLGLETTFLSRSTSPCHSLLKPHHEPSLPALVPLARVPLLVREYLDMYRERQTLSCCIFLE